MLPVAAGGTPQYIPGGLNPNSFLASSQNIANQFANLNGGGGGSAPQGGGGNGGGSTAPGAYTSANGVQWVNGVPVTGTGGGALPGASQNSNQGSGMAAAPTQYQWNNPNAGSTDPNVYTTANYAYQNNVDSQMADVNRQNQLAYQNYQNAYNNWQQNGSQGNAPGAPTYATFDQNAFQQAYNNASQSGNWSLLGQAQNQYINPGSVYANNPNPTGYAGGPGGTYSAGPSGLNTNGVYMTGKPQGAYQNNPGGYTPQAPPNNATPSAGGGFQTPYSGPAPNQNYMNQYQPGNSFAGGAQNNPANGGGLPGPVAMSYGGGPNGNGQLTNGLAQFPGNGINGIIGGGQSGFGSPGTTFNSQNQGPGAYTQFGGYNQWGAPSQGNPFGYMTGIQNNGLGGGQVNIPQGFFNQNPMSYGYNNMNPLGGNSGNLSGLFQLLNSMGGIQSGGQGGGGNNMAMSYLAPLLGL